MGLAGKGRRAEQRKKQKASKKAARKAQYEAYAKSGKSSKRSRRRSRLAPKMGGAHAVSDCGNVGCHRCYPRDYNLPNGKKQALLIEATKKLKPRKVQLATAA